MKRLILPALLCVAFHAHASADTCPTDPIAGAALPPDTCASGKVSTWMKKCPKYTGLAYCFDISQPPPAEILCTSAYGTVTCEAWPQSDWLTYRYVWSVINGVAPGYSSDQYSPLLQGNCNPGSPGRVAVTVIAPNGAATSADVRFLCEGNE